MNVYNHDFEKGVKRSTEIVFTIMYLFTRLAKKLNSAVQ